MLSSGLKMRLSECFYDGERTLLVTKARKIPSGYYKLWSSSSSSSSFSSRLLLLVLAAQAKLKYKRRVWQKWEEKFHLRSWWLGNWKEDTDAFALLDVAVVQGAGAVRLVTESSSISGLTFASIWYVPLASTIDTTHQGFAFCAITSSPSLLALANTRHHTVAIFRVTIITNSYIGNMVNECLNVILDC